MLFVENYSKNVKFGYLGPILKKLRGDARLRLIAR